MWVHLQDMADAADRQASAHEDDESAPGTLQSHQLSPSHPVLQASSYMSGMEEKDRHHLAALVDTAIIKVPHEPLCLPQQQVLTELLRFSQCQHKTKNLLKGNFDLSAHLAPAAFQLTDTGGMGEVSSSLMFSASFQTSIFPSAL